MKSGYVLALDQGTTGSTAIVFDAGGLVRGRGYGELTQYFPDPGWVEHDAEEIWEVTQSAAAAALAAAGIASADLTAIGITNQRETTVLWDRATGTPVHRAIVWQCRRTAGICDMLRRQPALVETIAQRTGLVVDAYFSATKVMWLLDRIPGLSARATAGEIAFGTIDSWLLWKLTGGRVHATDLSNASRTMLFNIRSLDWDEELLQRLGVPRAMLPNVQSSSGFFGTTVKQGPFEQGIPVAGVAGDQQAALFGQTCFRPGMVKNTYGTGCFLLMNTGTSPVRSRNGLLTTIAWGLGDKVTYALEGSIFVAGAAVQWLRDGLGIIRSAAETEELALSVPDTGGVYLVPAFVGLGAPYWDMHARGAIVGVTRGTNKAHLARATLEAMAYQTLDVVSSMQADAGASIPEMRVDGGASANNFLMQFQSDILSAPVSRPSIVETTAQGAAYLAGLGVGLWRTTDEVERLWQQDRRFEPAMDEARRSELVAGWHRAVERSRGWQQ